MGVSVGCQPSWDASDSSGCPTFLLALSKKILFFSFLFSFIRLHKVFYFFYFLYLLLFFILDVETK